MHLNMCTALVCFKPALNHCKIFYIMNCFDFNSQSSNFHLLYSYSGCYHHSCLFFSLHRTSGALLCKHLTISFIYNKFIKLSISRWKKYDSDVIKFGFLSIIFRGWLYNLIFSKTFIWVQTVIQDKIIAWMKRWAAWFEIYCLISLKQMNPYRFWKIFFYVYQI